MLMQALAALATGAAVLLFALYYVRNRDTKPADLRIKRLADEPETRRRGLSWDEVRRRGPSTLPLLRDLLVDSEYGQSVAVQLEQAGLKLRAGEFLIGRIAITGIVFVLVLAAGRSAAAFVFALALAAVAYVLPSLWLRMMRQRRLDAITRQLPEAATMMANGMRAGFAFQHGLSMVAEQMEPPIADEFNRMTLDMNLGSSIEDALNGLLQRVDSEELNLLVTAVLVQRSTGGNLAEILETTAEQIREKERLVGEVRTMTSQQRFSGTVMAFWPVILLALFSFFNWGQTKLLFTTGIGLVLIAIGAGLQVLGYVSIRKILDVRI
jgi:tight adherence protein B